MTNTPRFVHADKRRMITYMDLHAHISGNILKRRNALAALKTSSRIRVANEHDNVTYHAAKRHARRV
jgi:hypothetical protein